MSEQIDWSKAPEGADKYNMHNSMFYKGERPDLQVFMHNCWGESELMRCNEDFVYRPATPSWSGEGLPPVGVVCEVYHDGDWYETKIIGIDTDDGSCVFKTHSDYETPYDGFVSASSFRPIRTIEQIEADQREAQIVAIHDAIVTSVKVTLGQCDSWRKVAEMVYDAGFKRPE